MKTLKAIVILFKIALFLAVFVMVICIIHPRDIRTSLNFHRTFGPGSASSDPKYKEGSGTKTGTTPSSVVEESPIVQKAESAANSKPDRNEDQRPAATDSTTDHEMAMALFNALMNVKGPDGRPTSELDRDKTMLLVNSYIDSCSKPNGTPSDFVHPDGLMSFKEKLIRRSDVDKEHRNYLSNTYDHLEFKVLARGSYENSDGISKMRIPVAITGVKKDGQMVDMISYRNYEAKPSSLGLRICAEDSIVSFNLMRMGYSTKAPARGRVHASDGKLALRYEPSRRLGDKTVIKTLRNGDTVRFWPVPNPVFDSDEGGNIQWVVMLTDDDIGGLGSMRLLDVVTPAQKVY